MRTARHEDDILSRAGERCAERGSDAPGADDGNAHAMPPVPQSGCLTLKEGPVPRAWSERRGLVFGQVGSVRAMPRSLTHPRARTVAAATARRSRENQVCTGLTAGGRRI